MTFLETLRVAWEALLANKLRSILTMLGIIIGVGSVIAVIAIGRGTQAAVVGELQGLGGQVFQIFPGGGNPTGQALQRVEPFRERDMQTLKGLLPDVAEVISFLQIGMQVRHERISAKGYRVQESGWIDPAYGGVKSFKLEPWGGDLQVLLRSEAGERVNGQLVLLASSGAIVAQEEVKGGRFTRQGLPAGEYRLVASAEGLGSVEHAITVVAGRTTVETVVLRDGSFSATGEVVDRVTQKPLAGAHVELRRSDGVMVGTASTNPLGRFGLSAPLVSGQGEYQVRVTAQGYAPALSASKEAGPGYSLDFTGTNRIEIQPGTGTIAGTLVNQAGQPVATTKVVLMRMGLGEVAAGETDKAGDFRFAGLAAGEGVRYQVVADEALDSMRAGWHDLLASDWIAAKPGVTVHTSVIAQSWVKYPLGQGTVGGRVTTPAGLPVDGATVELLRYTRVMESITSDADGSFSFPNVQASEKDGFALTPYMLRISKDGFVATREVTVAGEQRSTFEVQAGARLTVEAKLYPDRVVPKGRVTDLHGRPVAGAEVLLAVTGQAEELKAVTDTGGWYQLGAIPTTLASASLSVAVPGYLPASGLDVTAALAGGRLPTFQLTPRQSTLEGVVVDFAGKSVGSASVKLWSGGAVVAETRSDSDGFYQLEADLTASSLGLLTVGRKGYTGAGAISGRVVDEVGRPVVGVEVELVVEGQGVVKRALTGADGAYRFEVAQPLGSSWAWLRVKPNLVASDEASNGGMYVMPLTRLRVGEHAVAEIVIHP